jgi:hypothetical protein
MAQVKIQIERVVDENYPIWLEAALVDINGKRWIFIDKAPIFFTDYVLTNPPVDATMRCSVVKNYFDSSNREVYIISTETPDHIEDQETGCSEFYVYKEQLVF